MHHFVADEVFRSDKFDAATLAEMFAVDHLKDFVVTFHISGFKY